MTVDTRLAKLRDWLENTLDYSLISLEPASADASFRRYFRVIVQIAGENKTYVVMDAPPDKEAVEPFVSAAQALHEQNVHSPAIYHSDMILGFLVLEDLGDKTYLDFLAQDQQQLYSDALDSLIKIQTGAQNKGGYTPPNYSRELLEQELDVFLDWYVHRHLDQYLNEQQQLIWQDTKDKLIEACLEQPQVWVHRDFHSRNLMITESNSPGVIDFQDMVLGPISYDLASIFKDCYIEWPRTQQIDWLKSYLERAKQAFPEFELELDSFIRWYDLTALQRHLKVLGVFCRLNYRDGKSQYLNDLPLVKKYIEEALQIYPEFSYFELLFKQLNQTTQPS